MAVSDRKMTTMCRATVLLAATLLVSTLGACSDDSNDEQDGAADSDADVEQVDLT